MPLCKHVSNRNLKTFHILHGTINFSIIGFDICFMNNLNISSITDLNISSINVHLRSWQLIEYTFLMNYEFIVKLFYIIILPLTERLNIALYTWFYSNTLHSKENIITTETSFGFIHLLRIYISSYLKCCFFQKSSTRIIVKLFVCKYNRFCRYFSEFYVHSYIIYILVSQEPWLFNLRNVLTSEHNVHWRFTYIVQQDEPIAYVFNFWWDWSHTYSSKFIW
jgi:hypothetical protein